PPADGLIPKGEHCFGSVPPYRRGGKPRPMYSFRRFAILLALLLPATHSVLAQSPSSSSDAAPAAQDQAPTQTQAPAPTSTANRQGQVSVQSRIRARREQRRTQATHDPYSHPYEAFSAAAISG